MQKLLITGYGGFIGSTLVQELQQSYSIVAIDNFTSFSNYDIKKAREQQIQKNLLPSSQVQLLRADICDAEAMNRLFTDNGFDVVIHLAALTGVRQSLENPQAYVQANVMGFVNIFEAARASGVKNILYASSSSVYGLNPDVPYEENQRTDNPISAYAASKKANELFAHTYGHLYGINNIGLRFFTVYGPWTRPDMAAYIFMDAIHHNKPIRLFNEGKMIRDFTYVQDVVKSISLLVPLMQQENEPGSRIFNVGNHQPVYVIDFLRELEHTMGKKAIINHEPIQPGDMPATNANTDALFEYTGFRPNTDLRTAVTEMVNWYNGYSSL